jgi:hypothetical protein
MSEFTYMMSGVVARSAAIANAESRRGVPNSLVATSGTC